MVMHDREVRGGVLRWVTGEEIRAWRRKVKADLLNREGRRVSYTHSESTDKSIEAVERDGAGNPMFERPAPLKPRTPRETVELLTEVIAKDMLRLEKRDPQAFRRKVGQLRAETGNAYAHWTDEELARNMVEVCRAAIAEPSVRRVYTRTGRGRGWRGTSL